MEWEGAEGPQEFWAEGNKALSCVLMVLIPPPSFLCLLTPE